MCRDLNPLYNTELRPDYKDKYFTRLLPLGNKYAEVISQTKAREQIVGLDDEEMNLFVRY